MRIRTEFVYPPIPDRRCDWSAVDDSTYDGPGCAIGYGPTEAEAIADLLEQLEEREADKAEAAHTRAQDALEHERALGEGVTAG